MELILHTKWADSQIAKGLQRLPGETSWMKVARTSMEREAEALFR